MSKPEAPKLALRSVGSLFSDAWKLYKERWSVLVEIVLLPTLIVILGVVLIAFDLGSLFGAIGGLILFAGWVTFMYSILPVIYAVHHGTGVDASYKATIGWFWAYIWVVILQILALLGGFVMLIIPGLWLGTALAFTTYIFVIEGRHGIDALRQSKDYVKGYWWAVLGRILLLALIYIVAMAIIQIPFGFIGGKILSGIVSAVVVVFFVPFSAIYSYLIFENLRERKPELLDVKTKQGAGFIKASAIVGLVASILFVVLAVVLAAVGMFSVIGRATNFHYGPPPGYYGQMPPMQQ
jgi:hypothetical protein